MHGNAGICGVPFLLALVCAAVGLATPAAARDSIGGDRGAPAEIEVPLQRFAQAPPKKNADQPKGAEAPAGAAPAVDPEAWAINCSNQGSTKLNCEMTQNIVDQRTRTQVMLIAVKGAGAATAGALLFRVFHGIFLPAGLAVTIDKGQPVQLPFQKSDQTGVYAALPIDDRVLAELKRGKDLKLSVQINQGEALEIVARLAGFGPAYDKVKSLN